MAVIKINNFSGRMPSMSPRLIPIAAAQEAENINLDTGDLRALKSFLGSLTGINWMVPKTAFKLSTAWLLWAYYVNIVKADVSASDNRILFTGHSYPKLTNFTMATAGAQSTRPTTTRRLGVTKPTTILTVSVQGTGDTIIEDSVAYVYTLVTEFGEESAPYTATGVFNVEGGQYVRLSNFSVPTLAASGNDFDYIRLYRLSSTAGGSAEYQKVKARPANLSATPVYDIPVASVPTTATYVYDANDGVAPTALNQNLGDELVTEGWDPPPDDMEGLVRFSNGMYAGFVGNKLYLNVPGYYYAFPSTGTKNYTIETAHDVMSLGVLNDALIVGTQGYPEVISGIDARAMQRSPLPYQQPCLSKRGLVSTPTAVFYPCPDGMFMLDSSGGRVITEETKLINREDWNAYPLTAMITCYYNQKLYVFFEGYDTGFIYDFTRDYIIDFDIGITVKHAFVNPVEDRLYVLGLAEGQSNYGIYYWEGGSGKLSATFKSKLIETAPTNLSAARLEGDYSGGSVTFALYADGVLKHTVVISSDEGFRLPGGFRAREWEIRLTWSGAEISSLYLASSMGELRNG